MINTIIRLLLIISIFLNVALYQGWIDLGQYRNYVDRGIQSGQDIWNSDELQNLVDLVDKKFKESYGEDIEKVKEDIKQNIKEYGKEQAKQMLQEQYDKLDANDVNVLVEDAESEIVEEDVVGTGSKPEVKSKNDIQIGTGTN